MASNVAPTRNRALPDIAVIGGPLIAILIGWASSSIGNNAGDGLALANVALLLAAVTVAVALTSWLGGVMTSIAAALSLNWFHTEPVRTFRITDGRDLVAVLLLGLIGVGVSISTALRVRRASLSVRSADATEAQQALLESSRSDQPIVAVWKAAITATCAELGLVTARVSDTTPGDMPRVSRQLGADTIGSNHSFILPESGAAIPIESGSGHSCVVLTRHQPERGIQRRSQFRDKHELAVVLGRSVDESSQPDAGPHRPELRVGLRGVCDRDRHHSRCHTNQHPNARKLLGRPDSRNDPNSRSAVNVLGTGAGLARRRTEPAGRRHSACC